MIRRRPQRTWLPKQFEPSLIVIASERDMAALLRHFIDTLLAPFLPV